MNFKPLKAEKTAKKFRDKIHKPAIPKKPAKDPKDFPKGKRSLTSVWLFIKPAFGYLDGKIDFAIKMGIKSVFGKLGWVLVAVAVVVVIILILK